MKKYEGIMKDIRRNMWEIRRTFPIYGLWDLEKFRARPLGQGGGGCSQFPGLGLPQRKDIKHVKMTDFIKEKC